MKSKRKTMLVCLIAGLSLLASTAFASALNMSGYAELKRVGKDFVFDDTKNVSFDVDVSLKANDESIVSAQMYAKIDGDNYSFDTKEAMLDNQNASSTMLIGDTGYTYDSETDTYYVMNYGNYNRNVTSFFNASSREVSRDSDEVKFAEAVMDLLAGDVKNQFVKGTENGMDVISIDMQGGQIPEVARLGFTLMMKDLANTVERTQSTYSSSDSLLQTILLQDARIDQISGKVYFDANGKPANGSMTVKMSGTENGAAKTLTFDLSVKMYDYGTTQVIAPDLTGKKVVDHSKWYTDTKDVYVQVPRATSEPVTQPVLVPVE